MPEEGTTKRNEIADKAIYVLLRMIDSNHGPLVILLLFVLCMFLGSLYLIPDEKRLEWMQSIASNHFTSAFGWALALAQPPIYLWLRNVSRKADASEIKRLNEANQRLVQMELNLNLATSKPKS